MWWADASLGLGAVGAAANFFGRQDQARLMRRETDEEVRRFQEHARQREGMAQAAGAASGVEGSSRSLQDYSTAMHSEFQRQADWMRTAGYRRAGAVDTSATFGLFGDLGSAMFHYGAANKWWRTEEATQPENPARPTPEYGYSSIGPLR